MKKLVIILMGLGLGVSAYAQVPVQGGFQGNPGEQRQNQNHQEQRQQRQEQRQEHRAETFAKVKQEVLRHLSQREQILATERNCVSQANNHEALKGCKQQAHAAMEQQRESHREFRENLKQDMRSNFQHPPMQGANPGMPPQGFNAQGMPPQRGQGFPNGGANQGFNPQRGPNPGFQPQGGGQSGNAR